MKTRQESSCRYSVNCFNSQNNGWITVDPFANYHIHMKAVDRGYLTEEELERILKKDFQSQRLEQVRDIFIFSCFTGLAYIDVYNLKKKTFVHHLTVANG